MDHATRPRARALAAKRTAASAFAVDATGLSAFAAAIVAISDCGHRAPDATARGHGIRPLVTTAAGPATFWVTRASSSDTKV